MWWNGPDWLSSPESGWPSHTIIPEVKTNRTVTFFAIEIKQLFDKYSSLLKLQTLMSYCLRLLHNTRVNRNNRHIGPLTPTELNSAMKKLVYLSQQQDFSEELVVLKNSYSPRSKNNLLKLFSSIDTEGLLRVGGRLQYSNLPYDSKHPLLLNGKGTAVILADIWNVCC